MGRSRCRRTCDLIRLRKREPSGRMQGTLSGRCEARSPLAEDVMDEELQRQSSRPGSGRHLHWEALSHESPSLHGAGARRSEPLRKKAAASCLTHASLVEGRCIAMMSMLSATCQVAMHAAFAYNVILTSCSTGTATTTWELLGQRCRWYLRARLHVLVTLCSYTSAIVSER